MSVRAIWDEYADGSDHISANGRLSKPVGPYLLSDSLDYEAYTGPAASRQLTNETDASVLVLQGIIFVTVLASETLYGRLRFASGKAA